MTNAELEIGRRTLWQFVSKVVVKDEKGTIYYTFPIGSGDTKRLGVGKGGLDPRDFVPFPSQKQGFGVPILIQKHTDKVQLRQEILLMRQQGMSYREIGKALEIDSSRAWQIVKNGTNSALEN